MAIRSPLFPAQRVPTLCTTNLFAAMMAAGKQFQDLHLIPILSNLLYFSFEYTCRKSLSALGLIDDDAYSQEIDELRQKIKKFKPIGCRDPRTQSAA